MLSDWKHYFFPLVSINREFHGFLFFHIYTMSDYLKIMTNWEFWKWYIPPIKIDSNTRFNISYNKWWWTFIESDISIESLIEFLMQIRKIDDLLISPIKDSSYECIYCWIDIDFHTHSVTGGGCAPCSIPF